MVDKDQIPVVIPFFGPAPFYLGYCLSSAKKYNNSVVLLGDSSTKDFWNEHFDSSVLKSEKWELFQSNYIHLSTNNYQFELNCFKRYFILEEWMKATNTDRCMMLDGDVITCNNFNEFIEHQFNSEVISGICTPFLQGIEHWESSPHCSYWTLEGLSNFTNYCLDAYKKEEVKSKLLRKYNYIISRQLMGGVSDMTLLYFWSQGESKIFNFLLSNIEKSVDLNINISSNYFDRQFNTFFGKKKIKLKNNKLHLEFYDTNELIELICIHCQGPSKYLMKYYANDFALLRNRISVYGLIIVINSFYALIGFLGFKSVNQLKQFVKKIFNK